MPHVPAPDAVREIRAAATTNMAALLSVASQIDHQLEHVEAFPNAPSKGQLRDGLQRLQSRYRESAKLNESMVRLATQVLDMLASPTPPEDDPAPALTTWSTGDW